jgi:glutamine amidotransferase/cyclase
MDVCMLLYIICVCLCIYIFMYMCLSFVNLSHTRAISNLATPHHNNYNSQTYIHTYIQVAGGREVRPIDAVQLAKGCQLLGAGEILLNSIDADGQKKGFDVALVKAVSDAVTIPVIASSGAGAVEHFTEVFQKSRAEAALAAGIFHREEVPLGDVKAHLSAAGIPVRQC